MPERSTKAACGSEVLDAIRQAYPGNRVTDDVVYDEESYYDAIRDEVRGSLGRIGKSDLLYDRPPEGRPHWGEGDDPDEDPPGWVEDPASYDLLFLALQGEQYQYEGELEEEEAAEDSDEPVLVNVPTVGRIGCAVGISIVAPFAKVCFTDIELAEDGTGTLPDIWPFMFGLDGEELDLDAYYEELFLEEGINALRGLREEIARVLRSFDIRVLSEEELKTPVSGLKADPVLNPMETGKTASVDSALFFQAF